MRCEWGNCLHQVISTDVAMLRRHIDIDSIDYRVCVSYLCHDTRVSNASCSRKVAVSVGRKETDT
jgi:hypothetical protein